jgi:hypothetical protein
LNKDSKDLLERLADRLPSDRLENCRTFSKVGEWGVLVDEMCAVLVKRNIPVTQDERDALADLLDMFPIPAEHHKYINNREEILASLTITDAR